MSGLRINIGAGRTRVPELVNVDIAPWADVTVDLDREPLPFDDESAELIFSYHTLEHLDNYLGTLGEIHRVLRHGGWLLLGLPYVTLTEYHQVNPYHYRGFNEHSFAFFDPERLMGSAVEGQYGIEFREVFHDFHYMPGFDHQSEEEKEWSRRHLLNVVRSIDFGLLAVKSGEHLPILREHAAVEMKAELDRLLNSRTRYEERP